MKIATASPWRRYIALLSQITRRCACHAPMPRWETGANCWKCRSESRGKALRPLAERWAER